MARKRSRKRRKQRRRGVAAPGPAGGPGPVASQPAATEPQRATVSRRRSPPDGPPPPPWGSFPLSELVILIGILLLIAGFFVAPPRGFVMLAAGLSLASLGGLELSVREHLAGYRSHTVLLAGAAGMAVLGTLLVLNAGPAIAAGAAAVSFGLCAWALANLFRRRSGGALFRIKG